MLKVNKGCFGCRFFGWFFFLFRFTSLSSSHQKGEGSKRSPFFFIVDDPTWCQGSLSFFSPPHPVWWSLGCGGLLKDVKGTSWSSNLSSHLHTKLTFLCCSESSFYAGYLNWVTTRGYHQLGTPKRTCLEAALTGEMSDLSDCVMQRLCRITWH